MQIIVEAIQNIEKIFWIWKKEISNVNCSKIYPATISNFGSGQSVAVYKVTGAEKEQIAQLMLPDYRKLQQAYAEGSDINLNFTYINDFTWLGHRKPYEVEALPYKKISCFRAQCSFWHNMQIADDSSHYLHIMQLEIETENMEFSYSAFFNIELDFCNLKITHGNILFDYSKFYCSRISFGGIECSGDRWSEPEISFRYIRADGLVIDTLLMPQKLSVDFLLAKTKNTIINLDPLPVSFKNLCFYKAEIEKISITNSEIDSLDISESYVSCLKFIRCKFLGSTKVAGTIGSLLFDNCQNLGAFEIAVTDSQNVNFSHTINSGKFYISNFESILKTMVKSTFAKTSHSDIEQLLMLKENFRQNGEYHNEDCCHLLYHKLKNRQEKNCFKKLLWYFIGLISGYGTKPFNMILLIVTSILGFAALFFFVPGFQFKGVNTFFDCIYVSGITFFTVGYGDIVPINFGTKLIVILEAFWGVGSMSYFLVLLSRKIIR